MVPGLYVEKGWVHESIDYNFTPPPEEKPAEPEVVEEEDGEEATTNESQGTIFQNECFFLNQLWCFFFFFLGLQFFYIHSWIYIYNNLLSYKNVFISSFFF